MSHLTEKLFPPGQQPALSEYLATVRHRLSLSRRHTREMLEDHVKALRCLCDKGLSLEEAMARLSPARLGTFYQKERTDWYPLDHAAKIPSEHEHQADDGIPSELLPDKAR